jgi:hypothetical protein
VALGYAAFSPAEYAVWIAMLVYAFQQGGATTAGVVALAQMAPSALLAPVGGALADRRPAAALALGYAVLATVTGATAAALLGDAPPLLVYALAVVATTVMTVIRPAQAALAPALSRTPEELTGFNVVAGWVESASLLVAALLTGLVLAVGEPGAVFAGATAFVVVGCLLVAALARRSSPAAPPADTRNTVGEVVAGLRAVATHRPVRLLVGFLVAQFVAIGIVDVVVVILALDVLDLGESGVGYLNAALGVGALAGATAALSLIGRPRLVPPIFLGTAALGSALVVLGVHSTTAAALALLVVAGAGSALVDVGGRTLLQRIAPPSVMARVFALSEALSGAGFALGSILVPVLVAVGGTTAALITAGALLPALALLRFAALRSIDAEATVPVVEISLLRSIPIFAPLPAPALEGLARSLEPNIFPAGSVILREGEAGERFYAIADGEVDISRNGTHVVTRRRGEGFGEIALLRDVPRTATATARTDTLLYALESEPFVLTVTGHAPTAQVADEVVRERSGS